MVFEEPKVEFVKIDRTLVIATSACDEDGISSGNVETCDGNGAPSNNCPQEDVNYF
jgi:hypothetical protein